MKIVINPKYKELEEFIKELPSIFMDRGETIQARRNIIKTIIYKRAKLNIKRYRVPIFINRIIYTFFRKSKAYKAYYNAIKVVEKGFNTPYPISYIEEREGGLLSLSYFISTQLENVKEIREYYFTQAIDIEDKKFLTAFAQYTAKLHEAGILHLDYSPGNILITEIDNEYHFSLVDINRMKFGKIDLDMGCQNFCRLFEYDEPSILIAEEYAKARKFDSNECIRTTLLYKHQFEKKKERKKRLKSLFKIN
jgi:serine/threonine protein kinase